MATKLDMESAGKYLALGGGAVVVPSVVMGTGISGTLASVPFWGQALWGAITVGGIVLASVGVGLADKLFFNK